MLSNSPINPTLKHRPNRYVSVLGEKKDIFHEKSFLVTIFKKIADNPSKDIAFSPGFCYNNTEFADSMHAKEG